MRIMRDSYVKIAALEKPQKILAKLKHEIKLSISQDDLFHIKYRMLWSAE